MHIDPIMQIKQAIDKVRRLKSKWSHSVIEITNNPNTAGISAIAPILRRTNPK